MQETEDRELERYLRGGDALSQAYAGLRNEEPSAALDRFVLAQARAAVQRGAGKRLWQRRWPTMMALAATVLLSVGIVMRIALEQQPALVPASKSPAPSAPARADAPVSEQERVQPASQPAALDSGFNQQPKAKEEQRAFGERGKDASANVVTLNTAPAVLPPAETAAPAAATATARQDPSAEAYRYAAPQPAAPASAVGARESDSTADAKESAALSRDEATHLGPKAEGVIGHSSGVAGASTAAAPLEKKAAGSRDPEEWLAEINRMRQAGQVEAAARELERFKAAYPNYLESRNVAPDQ